MPGGAHRKGKPGRTVLWYKALGKLYRSVSSLFSASSMGVLSPQKKSPPTAMLLPASPAKAPETEPIDVAAHLQLLGESLSLIGHRLQETEVRAPSVASSSCWYSLDPCAHSTSTQWATTVCCYTRCSGYSDKEGWQCSLQHCLQ